MSLPTRRRALPDRGALSLEAVILLPALILVLLLIVAFGRIQSSANAVDSAARNAARAASLERDGSSARTAGTTVAEDFLAGQGLHCTATSIDITTAGFSAALGQAATTTATVTCTVPLSDLAVPGLPGSKSLTSSFTSPIDSYRARG